ncbi:response regulator transcription factor [Ralstonia flaminis]|jgi:two-component system OmpR family response regulator|uniref:Transcriptional regulatory protein TcrA n=1 Tax=Ralstonia flaminis TaxID=3058597 RepID=A0ABN9JHS7_9RALS|nr:response regulator transcription factor [Ralstonia sp. LMG 18101]CAJ0812463.1 Transcriptional regulatory protein TcrA [Ralstonia sp. LMG 18101]
MNILLIEDDRKAARLLARGLEEEGFTVALAHAAEEAHEPMIRSADLVILDWMLPGKEGVTFCAELRRRDIQTPILMLTARDAHTDRITGLNTGADDYLTKPFVFDELLARVRALLRRARLVPMPALAMGDLKLEPTTRSVMRASTAIDVTPKEYAILELLLRHAGGVVSRAQLAEHIWHADLIAIDNLIDVHMKNLRRKIDPPGLPALIQTVRGQGFRLSTQAHAQSDHHV